MHYCVIRMMQKYHVRLKGEKDSSWMMLGNGEVCSNRGQRLVGGGDQPHSSRELEGSHRRFLSESGNRAELVKEEGKEQQ